MSKEDVTDLSGRFRINSPDIVHETIDGETVIVNLSNGVYYSTDGTGAQVWSLLECGLAFPQIVESLATRYKGGRDGIKDDVGAFLRRLAQENLIVPEGGTATPRAPVPSSSSDGPVGISSFERPELHKYTDMEDLLLLDPIHEVEEAGWPHKSGSET